MLEIYKQNNNQPMTVIRAATGNELSEYEKRKLATVEENAQENKIEVIRVNNKRLYVDPAKKEVKIELGDLAFKSKIKSEDFNSDELFFIKCELNDEDLLNTVE